MGVGAMVGAGIFALLGEAGAIAFGGLVVVPDSRGIAALEGIRSYLGKKYASESGLMGYLAAGFGKDSRSLRRSRGWSGRRYIVVSMVAVSFGSYAAGAITGGEMPGTLVKAMASVIVIAVVMLNALGGAGVVAKAQSLVIRLHLRPAGTRGRDHGHRRLEPARPHHLSSRSRQIIGSIALTFFAFLGFGMVSFTAKDLKNEGDLGPATYIALAIATITYVGISLGVFGQLRASEATAAGPTAIALAAKPVLGVAATGSSRSPRCSPPLGAVTATPHTLHPASSSSLARQANSPSISRRQGGAVPSAGRFSPGS